MWFIAGLTKRLAHLQEVIPASGAHAPHKRHHTAYGGLRSPGSRCAADASLVGYAWITCRERATPTTFKIHLSPSYGDDQHPAPHDRRRDIAYGGSLAYRCDGLARLADFRLAHLLDRTVPLPVVHAVVYRRARPPKPPRLGRWQQVLADALD